MYINYGDVNFFEQGILVNQISDTEFNILRCEPYLDEENLYMFALLNVNIDDEWIDRNAVMSYIGMDEFNPALYALGCTDYYAWENFGADSYGISHDWRWMTRQEVEEEVTSYIPLSCDPKDELLAMSQNNYCLN